MWFLYQNISPRVLIVEEAGQVLEAHILASLVDSGTCSCASILNVYSLLLWKLSPTPDLHRGPRAITTQYRQLL